MFRNDASVKTSPVFDREPHETKSTLKPEACIQTGNDVMTYYGRASAPVKRPRGLEKRRSILNVYAGGQ